MKVLVLNSGSSSIKFQLFSDEDWVVLASGSITRIGEGESRVERRWMDGAGEAQSCNEAIPIASHHDGLERIIAGLRESGSLADLAELRAVGHRVVHGGEAFHAPTIVDDDVVDVIRKMIPLAPLHNPANLDGILVARELFPEVPQVAVFDTAFHQTMPRTSYRYAIPEYLYREHRVRRYGFHGTSHRYVAKRAAAMLRTTPEHCNLITLHLGNGASATAIRHGTSVDTSMGMTPLEGLIMGTRCGDVDPAIHFYLAKNLGFDNQTLDDLLNRKSGLLGICGVNDMREIHRMAEQGDENADLAIGMTCHRLKKYIGAYYAELGTVDAIVFTGGIGENDADVRARIMDGLAWTGLAPDTDANRGNAKRLHAADSAIGAWIVPADEERTIAADARRLMAV